MQIRRLQAGDEAVVTQLATREPRTVLLRDPRTIFLVAFDDGEPVGFVLAYELQRRHGYNVTLCIYEVEVNAAHVVAASGLACCVSSNALPASGA